MRYRSLYALAGMLSAGLLMVGSVSAAAAAAPGSLDQSFGTGGKVLTDLGVGGGVASDAVLQANGDIVVSGGFGVARYLPTGQLDKTFGAGGLASTGFAGDGDSGTAVAVQPDGKIIWAGSQTNPGFAPGGTFEFAVARFNPDGTLDSSFGVGGRVSTEFFAPPLQGAQEFAAAVLVQPDAKILVAGSVRQGQNKFAPIQGAIARYNANGSLDASFGTGGKVVSASHGAITALGLDSAGDIFVLPAVAEFTPAGQADATVTPAAITASSRGGPAAFLPSGQSVLANSVGMTWTSRGSDSTPGAASPRRAPRSTTRASAAATRPATAPARPQSRPTGRPWSAARTSSARRSSAWPGSTRTARSTPRSALAGH
jgi:uncharacterized delta-60 repeat protein